MKYGLNIDDDTTVSELVKMADSVGMKVDITYSKKEQVGIESEKPEFRFDVKVGHCIETQDNYYQLRIVNKEDEVEFVFVSMTKEEYVDLCFDCLELDDGCILDLALDDTNVKSWFIESGEIKPLPKVIDVVLGDRLVYKDTVFVVTCNAFKQVSFTLEDDWVEHTSPIVRKLDVEIGDIINVVGLKSKWRVANFSGVFFDKV